jgi:cation transport regulator ChaB
MPYAKNSELPPAVKKLPANALRIWKGAFNSAIKDHSESSAFAIAWSAVHKAGFGKDGKKGTWGKGKGR